MKVFNLLRNLWQRAKSYSDSNLQTAKDYTDEKTDYVIESIQSSVVFSNVSYKVYNVSVTKSGYKPIGILDWWVDYSSLVYFTSTRLLDDNTIVIVLGSRSNGNISQTIQAHISVLYQKVGG